jgi:DNA repair protein RadA/Sms
MSRFGCPACGYAQAQWFGRCPECGGWNAAVPVEVPGSEAVDPLSIVSLDTARIPTRLVTGIGELDRVLGGGLVSGGVYLLAGQPGIGKSTLVLQALSGLMAAGATATLVGGEESLDQVAARAQRVGTSLDALPAVSTTSLPPILDLIRSESPDVVVIDSVQTISDPALPQPAASVVQVRECAAALARVAKQTGTAVVLTGHVTKDGSVAGPKTLEHVVDCVLSLDGERTGALRLLRATKNRFGPADETGVFSMTSTGLQEVPDPSAVLLADRATTSGSVVSCAREGSRPVLVEIQALIGERSVGQPRRVAIGVDQRRLTLLMGVLSSKLRCGEHDVFVSAAGGITVREPALDLAICVALASSQRRVPVDAGTIVLGEVGLSGEVRRIPDIDRRLREAARLGFTRAVVPLASDECDASVTLVRVASVDDALANVRALEIAS